MTSLKEMTVGQRFKKYRIDKGLSQAELTEGICSYSVVSQLENERNIPSAKIMGKLAERLGVPLKEIMGEQENQLGVNFQLDIIKVYIETGDYERALELVEHVQGEYQDLLSHQTTQLLICYAECLTRTGKQEKAIQLLLPFIEQQEIQQSEDDETICDAYNKLGNAYFLFRDFEKAYQAYKHGYLVSLRMNGFDKIAARVTHNLGITCNQLAMHREASIYLEKAHQYHKSISDTKSLAKVLFELAIATRDESYMSQAKALFEGLNAVKESQIVRQHFAFYVSSKENYKSAIEELRTVGHEFGKIGEEGLSVYTFARAIMLCLDNNNQSEAKEYLQLANNYKERMLKEDPYLLAYFYRALARLNLCEKKYGDCIRYSKLSSEMYAKMEMYADSSDSLQLSAEAYDQQDMHKAAYEISKKVSELLRKSRRRGNE